MVPEGPLGEYRVWEIADTPASAFLGRMMVLLGASVEMLEPTGGSALREQPPFSDGRSALFAYLAAGKSSIVLPSAPEEVDLAEINVIVHDRIPLPAEWSAALEAAPVPERGRVVVSVLPYGMTGPKSGWKGSELTLFQGGGEGYLMPSGLGYDLFPDRSPIGVGRYLGSYQAGLTAALSALAGLRSSRRHNATEWIDVSVQDAQLSLNYFTYSRYVEGALERRANRAFSYGGVFTCADGHVEIVPLEQHQWLNLREMLGDPAWASGPEYDDAIERAAHGGEINMRIAEWAASRTRSEITDLGVQFGVPCGPYTAPEDLPSDSQFRDRGFFAGTDDGRPFPGSPITFDRWDRAGTRSAPELPRGDSR